MSPYEQIIAEFMGIPQLTFAREIQIEGQKAVIKRVTQTGYQTVECGLPAVVTIASGSYDHTGLPLCPSAFRRFMRQQRRKRRAFVRHACRALKSDANGSGSRWLSKRNGGQLRLYQFCDGR